MNALTEFQKKIIDKIISREVNDIYSFFKELFGWKYRNYIWSGYKEIINEDYQHDCDYLYEINKDQIEDIRLKISEYISLFNLIEKNNYIYSIEIKKRIFMPLMIFKSATQIDELKLFDLMNINQLIYNRSKYEFFPSPELAAFKERGYITVQQEILLKEIKERKRAQYLTIIVALLSIFVGLMSIIVDIVYSGKDRDVNIKNENAFKDTIFVKYVKDNENIDSNILLIDSIKK